MAASTSKNKKIVEKFERSFKGIGEPTVTKENYKTSISEAMNWYAAHEDDRKKREWVNAYLKSTKREDLIPKTVAVPDSYFIQVGALVRIKSRGGFLSDDHLALVETKITDILNKADEIEVSKKDIPEKKKAPKADVIDDYCTDIDLAIDEFCTTKKTSFNISNYFASKSVNPSQAKRIGDRFASMEAEVSEAITGEDEQLVEGYSYFTKSELGKFHKFIQSILTACNQVKASQPSARKLRAKKEKPAAVLVSKLKYLKEFPELNLKSIDPKSIIGSNEVWVFNTSSNKMQVYRAPKGQKLGVHRTSILNFDVTTSEQRVLRKPAEFLALPMAKASLAEAFKKLTTKSYQPNGRIGEDCILLKVF